MIPTSLDLVPERRLLWPEWQPRASRRTKSPFKSPEIETQESEVRRELSLMGVADRNIVVSRNRERSFAGDPGVAAWFLNPHREYAVSVFAADQYDTMASNLRAIALTIHALRALDRWGVYTVAQASKGAEALALPAPARWWETLELPEGLTLPAYEGQYRALARARGASAELNEAIRLAREALR